MVFTYVYLVRRCAVDGVLETSPYGVDPVFKSGTSMYNPDLDNTAKLLTYYNCTQELEGLGPEGEEPGTYDMYVMVHAQKTCIYLLFIIIIVFITI